MEGFSWPFRLLLDEYNCSYFQLSLRENLVSIRSHFASIGRLPLLGRSVRAGPALLRHPAPFQASSRLQPAPPN